MAQQESNYYNLEMIADFTNAQMMELLSSLIQIFFICVTYLYVVYFGGPQFMKNRKPYSLKRFIQCYNLFQIIANFWIVFNIVTYGHPFAPIWRYCESLDVICGRNSEKQREVLRYVILLKMVDLIETVVFVLRKKDNQISFLHTYHHLMTFGGFWVMVRHFPHSYLMTIFGFNCSVHVIMYVYYFLSTFESNIQRRLLPFKKSITILQMVQIAFLTMGCAQGFIFNCENKYMTYLSISMFFVGTSYLLLFLNFYRSYKKSKTA